jgi:hypothetical protein
MVQKKFVHEGPPSTVLLSGVMSVSGTKLPFAALQHHVGYWGYSGLNADVAFGPLMTLAV